MSVEPGVIIELIGWTPKQRTTKASKETNKKVLDINPKLIKYIMVNIGRALTDLVLMGVFNDKILLMKEIEKETNYKVPV